MMKYSNILIVSCLINGMFARADMVIDGVLNKYKDYLEQGTYTGYDWSRYTPVPASRYYTFRTAFEQF